MVKHMPHSPGVETEDVSCAPHRAILEARPCGLPHHQRANRQERREAATRFILAKSSDGPRRML
jgi:hypothetical protein